MAARPIRLSMALLLASTILAGVVPAVGAANGLQVTTPFPAVAVAPGSKVTFDLSVTSVRSETVDLSLSGVPAGWTASLIGGGNVVDAVTATPDTPGSVRLDVTVPVDATNGSRTITVSAKSGVASDTLAVTVRVDTQAAGDVSLTTSTPTLTGASDANFSFELTFKNDTPQDVTLSVAATGPDGWTVKPTLTGETQAASTVVKAGASQTVSVAVTPTSDAAAGQYPIQVVATAGERTATADLGIEITGSYSADLSTPNDLLSASGSAGTPTVLTFDITNTGTAPITDVKLTGTPPTGWTVTFDPESVASIGPNQVGTVNATVTPSGEAVAGDYVVSFQTTAAESGVEATASIRFTVETSPLWAFVGIAIIVLILAGLFWVFRTYGRR